MLRIISTIAFAIILAASPSLLAAGPRSDNRSSEIRELMDMEGSWISAIRNHDVPILRRILGRNFQDISWNGRFRTKADMIAQLRRTTGQTSMKFSDWSVQVHGDIGIVRGLNTVTSKKFGTVRLRFTDIFLKRAGEWKAIDAQETMIR